MRHVWIVICLALLVGCKSSPETKGEQRLVEVSVTDYEELPASNAWVAGKQDAIVTMHSFVDPAGPKFAAVWTQFERLQAEHDEEVRLVMFAPANLSPAGYDLLVALRAAAMQGRQVAAWEALRQWDKAWRTGGAIALTASLADEIGLDVDAFQAAVQGGSAAEIVDEEMKQTAAAGLDGALALNGRPYFEMVSPQPLDAAIAETLDGAQRLIDAGAQPAEIYARHAAANEDTQPFGQRLVDSEILPIGGSPTFGNRNGLVKVVAFMDFQCPFSKRAAGMIAQLAANNSEVEIVFKHMPLVFHGQAREAAAISVAAAAQGKFWEMSELLFLNQKRFKGESMDELAAEFGNQLGLNVSRLLADREKAYPIVDADVALAEKVGVRGTPNFFVNGELVTGAVPLAVMQKAVDEQLAAARELEVPTAALYKTAVKNSFEDRPKRGRHERPPKPPAYAKVPVTKDDPVKGAKSGFLVTIVEFADYQCPFCQRTEPTLAKLQKKYPKTVRFVFKHLPLSFHKSAEAAAFAAIAAGEQGKYWEMHDRLFAEKLPGLYQMDAYTEKLARKVGLKIGKFKKDRDAAEAKMQADMKLAAKINARGTPNFFINGRRFVGAKPLEAFVTVIEEELEFAESVKKETKLTDDALYDEVLKRRAEQTE